MKNKTQILNELKSYLQQNLGDNFHNLILFGSRVGNNYKKDSDFDCLIIINNDYNYKFEEKIIDLCYNISLKYNIIIDPHIISTNELNSLRAKQPIYINALNNGLYV